MEKIANTVVYLMSIGAVAAVFWSAVFIMDKIQSIAIL